MSIVTRHPWVRWAGPAAALAVVAAGSVIGSLAATADPTLPPRTPAALLVDLQEAKLVGLSGTVVQSADLGLPAVSLPGSAGRGSADLQSVTSGTHTWRVWYAGPDKARVALLGSAGESDVIRNGSDVWVWSSSEQKATHYTMPAEVSGSKSLATTLPSVAATGLAGSLAKTPQELADQALAMLDPSTEVTAPGTTTVAGRAAYQLVLTPRDTGSLVAGVRIAIDAETKVPLRAQVMSTRIDTPAIEVGFSSVDCVVPEDRKFTFTAPSGTTVTEGTTPALPGAGGATGKPGLGSGANLGMLAMLAAHPQVVGTGWGTVVVANAAGLGALTGGVLPGGAASSGSPSAPTDKAGANTLARLLAGLPVVSGTWGSGRVLEGTLFTVVLADDGRVALGAVGVDRVTAALAAK